MSSFNSAQEAGGIAVGINGTISGFNADVEARLAHVLTDVGRWVEREAGALMGHIKMAVTSDKSTVTMFLMNGFQLHGVVKSFDGFTVVLDSDGKQQLIYKHAISTVVTPKAVELCADT